ncbi:putative elongator subunit Iki1 [Lyophyllum shimeji]|uniref:Elongator complex protein 5 n=1 Tax=Lyophyllum shimeji TaxID=47721 RepID=A0A9P3PIS5_LYOSH|nr:putative elongator subunit Iki1 [Lyophyllum shimeji]
MTLLSPIINDPPRLHQPLLLLQSSIAQSSLPVLRHVLAQNIKARSSNYFLLFSLACPPSPNLLNYAAPVADYIEIFDWVHCVPSYDDNWSDPRAAILSAVERGSLQVVINSIDALCSDVGSVSETYKFLSELLSLVRARPMPSRLILHATRPSELVPLLTLPTFSPSIVQLTAHPPVLLAHVAKDYLTPPPPASPKAKFWSVFLPLSERSRDVDRLVYGATGEGSSNASEMVVEILIRGGEGSGRKRGIERELEGWSASEGACDVTKLESLKGVWTKKTVVEAAPDPTHNVSFNLNLTSSQQESRAQVPLPYAHEGRPLASQTSGTTAAIFYDPDSADDLDAEDPDEDLDI